MDDDLFWGRVKFTLFSMMVSGSFLASYSVSTFYTSVVIVVSAAIRPIFLFSTFTAWLYECTSPDAIIKLIEAIYVHRHEENLVGEEECYRMLQEIVRSPELLKAMTGSSLKGSCDPKLDNLSNADRKKIIQLEKMEKKGFDIDRLRNQILKDDLF